MTQADRGEGDDIMWKQLAAAERTFRAVVEDPGVLTVDGEPVLEEDGKPVLDEATRQAALEALADTRATRAALLESETP